MRDDLARKFEKRKRSGTKWLWRSRRVATLGISVSSLFFFLLLLSMFLFLAFLCDLFVVFRGIGFFVV